MDLNTFSDLVTYSKNRINDTDPDEQVDDGILKTAINDCYMNKIGKIDKRIVSTMVPIINRIATFPDDMLDIEEITPTISDNDRRIGNSLITDKTGMFTLIYSISRDPMTSDDDTPDMDKKYFSALSTYGCARYWLFRKKLPLFQTYMQEYLQELEDVKSDDNIADVQQDVMSDDLMMGSDF